MTKSTQSLQLQSEGRTKPVGLCVHAHVCYLCRVCGQLQFLPGRPPRRPLCSCSGCRCSEIRLPPLLGGAVLDGCGGHGRSEVSRAPLGGAGTGEGLLRAMVQPCGLVDYTEKLFMNCRRTREGAAWLCRLRWAASGSLRPGVEVGNPSLRHAAGLTSEHENKTRTSRAPAHRRRLQTFSGSAHTAQEEETNVRAK